MRTLIRRIAAMLAIFAAMSVALMMFITTLDVVKRALTGASLAGAQEIAESLIVAVVYLGIAWAQYRREHVAIDMFTNRLPLRAAAATRFLAQLIIVGIVGWMLARTGLSAWEAFESGEVRFGLLQVPMWPARATIPLGLLVLLLVVFVDLWDYARTCITGIPPETPAVEKALT